MPAGTITRSVVEVFGGEGMLDEVWSGSPLGRLVLVSNPSSYSFLCKMASGFGLVAPQCLNGFHESRCVCVGCGLDPRRLYPTKQPEGG